MSEPHIPLKAPNGGLNFAVSRYEMSDEFATDLVNLIPGNGELHVRKNFTAHRTTTVETQCIALLRYQSGTTEHLISIDNDAGGTVTRILPSVAAIGTIGSTLAATTCHVVSANFNGLLLICAGDGIAVPKQYNGSAISNVSITLPGTGDWAALTTASIKGCCVHKSRVWWWGTNTNEALYTALLAHGGVVTSFPLDMVSDTGGNVMLITPLTLDGGNGPDDVLAFVLDTGEVLIYQGSDPNEADDWELVGRFQIPRPLNQGAVVKFGGDALILTRKGLVPIRQYASSEFGKSSAPWIEAINPELELCFTLATGNFGRIYYSTNSGFLYILTQGFTGVPARYCFVLNIASMKWTRFCASAGSNTTYTGQLATLNEQTVNAQTYDFFRWNAVGDHATETYFGGLTYEAYTGTTFAQIMKYNRTTNRTGDYGSSTHPIQCAVQYGWIASPKELVMRHVHPILKLGAGTTLSARLFEVVYDFRTTMQIIVDQSDGVTVAGGADVGTEVHSGAGQGYVVMPRYTFKVLTEGFNYNTPAAFYGLTLHLAPASI